MSSTQLSVVVPAFNEATRLTRGLPELMDGLASERAEIIVIDDGSTDGTAEVARRHLAAWPKHSVVSLPKNSGKGAAVRAGVVRARGDVIAFVDADMAVDPRDLGSLVGALEGNHVAVGSRSHHGSVVNDRTASRTMMTRTFGMVVGSTLRLPLGDTQCGFKAFKGSIAKLLFHCSTLDSFAFDVEVLNLAMNLGLRTQEVPVRWTSVDGSHIRPVRDAVQMMSDVARLRRVRSSQPAMQGVFLPDVPVESAPGIVRDFTRTVDLVMGWKGGSALLFPCVAPTQARRISNRLMVALEAYEPRRINASFESLFHAPAAIAGHSSEWAE